MSKETHVLPKQEILLGRAPGGEQWGEEAEEDRSATRLAVSGFMVMRLVSGLYIYICICICICICIYTYNYMYV